VVVRLAVQQVPLLDEQGQSLDVLAWLKEAQAPIQSRCVFFDHQGQRFGGRLIASALPAEAAERARAKARKKASKQQREIKEETLFLAGWLLVFCSLASTRWSDSQVLSLYRARWQVELVIKRMKQVLKLAQLRGQTALTNEASVLALLVCWALQQQEAQQAREVLMQAVEQVTLPATPLGQSETASAGPEACEGAVSSWLLTALCIQTLRVIVQGYWTPARLGACLPQLRRFVRGSPRQRQHQESTIRHRLTAHLGLLPPDPALLFSCSSP
jgi:hypothetical protein